MLSNAYVLAVFQFYLRQCFEILILNLEKMIDMVIRL